MDNAFEYAIENPLESEFDYPYIAREQSCKYDKSKGKAKVSQFCNVDSATGGPDLLRAALVNSPVSVAIEADETAFLLYTKGVITQGCGTNLDHGVLAIGYGTEDGNDYFLVKNSWGDQWGDLGFVKIGVNNVCGILAQPSYPLYH